MLEGQLRRDRRAVHQPEPAAFWYRANSRYACRSWMPSTEVAAASLPDCISFRTSTRRTSRSLILVHAIPKTWKLLISGNMTFLLTSSYICCCCNAKTSLGVQSEFVVDISSASCGGKCVKSLLLRFPQPVISTVFGAIAVFDVVRRRPTVVASCSRPFRCSLESWSRA